MKERARMVQQICSCAGSSHCAAWSRGIKEQVFLVLTMCASCVSVMYRHVGVDTGK